MEIENIYLKFHRSGENIKTLKYDWYAPVAYVKITPAYVFATYRPFFKTDLKKWMFEFEKDSNFKNIVNFLRDQKRGGDLIFKNIYTLVYIYTISSLVLSY